jgi:hypothetical protein
MKENNPDPADQGRRLTIQWTATLLQRPGHGQDQNPAERRDRYQRASAAAARLRAAGTEVSSASKSPDPRAEVPVRKSALGDDDDRREHRSRQAADPRTRLGPAWARARHRAGRPRVHPGPSPGPGPVPDCWPGPWNGKPRGLSRRCPTGRSSRCGERALRDGKLVYMAVPRLAEDPPFYELDPDRLPVPPNEWDLLPASMIAAIPVLAARREHSGR